MSWIDNPMIAHLDRFLDVATYRQMLIASNVANVDTPGYHTVDINFNQALRQAEEAQSSRGIDNDLAGDVRPVQGLLERPDGNNVDVDREGLLLAQTQMQFSEASALLREEFNRLQMAIKGI